MPAVSVTAAGTPHPGELLAEHCLAAIFTTGGSDD